MPEPSQLVLLEQLPTIAAGTKVRFLACVHAYDVNNANVLLKDRYPVTKSDAPTAIVNVEPVLGSLDYDILQIGAWLNVVGRVRGPDTTRNSSLSSEEHRSPRPPATLVEPNMIWSAGAIRLEQYSTAVKEYQSQLPEK